MCYIKRFRNSVFAKSMSKRKKLTITIITTRVQDHVNVYALDLESIIECDADTLHNRLMQENRAQSRGMMPIGHG
jgi:hypothetical protein